MYPSQKEWYPNDILAQKEWYPNDIPSLERNDILMIS